MSDSLALQMVHFDPATGEIRQAGFAFAYFEIEGWTLGELDGVEAVAVRPGSDTVDLASIVERDGLPPLVKIIQGARH